MERKPSKLRERILLHRTYLTATTGANRANAEPGVKLVASRFRPCPS